MTQSPWTLHDVTTADGLHLPVAVAGPEGAPEILLIHGYSQGFGVWIAQFRDAGLTGRFRLVAPDLRGHGLADAPREESFYDGARPWAADIAAVIAGCALQKPVLVGWSFGASVMLDYARLHGFARIAGLISVCGATRFTPRPPPDPASPPARKLMQAFEDMLSDDPLRDAAGTRAFVELLTAEPLVPELFDLVLAVNQRCTPRVRRLLVERRLMGQSNADLIADITVPLLLLHGAEDAIVPPAVARDAAPLIPTARLVEHDGIGHAPFLEDPARFNAELAEFAGACATRS